MSKDALCDADIRPSLRRWLERQHAEDSVMLLDEFPLFGGDVRADMVAVNGSMHGYEIKSARDTLDRLERQVGAYGAVFDRASLVVSECHLKDARKVVPDWWGILLVQCVGGGACFKFDRRGRANPDRQGRALVALLWRAEALSLLVTLGLHAGMRTATMSEMMDVLVTHVPLKTLGDLVRQKLRARGDWLAAARQKRDDATCPQPATPYRRQRTSHPRSPECTHPPN